MRAHFLPFPYHLSHTPKWLYQFFCHAVPPACSAVRPALWLPCPPFIRKGANGEWSKCSISCNLTHPTWKRGPDNKVQRCSELEQVRVRVCTVTSPCLWCWSVFLHLQLLVSSWGPSCGHFGVLRVSGCRGQGSAVFLRWQRVESSRLQHC